LSFTLASKMRVAVCVSGGGRSLSNLIRRQREMPFEIGLVVSSGLEIGANKITLDAGLPLIVLDFAAKNQRTAKETLYKEMNRYKIDLVLLAGFLKLFPVDPAWTGKIINIHPALLPKFGGKGMYGANVHNAVIAAGERVSGATVHFVNEQYDEGETIAQALVDVRPGDAPEALADRVFEAECNLLPWVLGQMASGALPHKNKVAILSESGGDWHEP